MNEFICDTGFANLMSFGLGYAIGGLTVLAVVILARKEGE